MSFYTIVTRKSTKYWVSLCLENGLVGQGETQEKATQKLLEAISSFSVISESENNVYSQPIAIEELHEFLTIEEQEEQTDIYELRKVYA